MRASAVNSSFDVAYWFVDKALNDMEYIQPEKLQRLLYLAQAYFAVANNNQMLMPAIFIAEENGPIEPHVFCVFENSKPLLKLKPLPKSIQDFLDSIWRKFGSHSGAYLSKVIKNHPPYYEARKKGARTPISIEAMVEYYENPIPQNTQENTLPTPRLDQVLRPRVMRSQDGKPVSVSKWILKKVDKK
ncbi:MAG: Panacea domain-containing protein [Alphaproteobacteria bacterium]